MSFIALSDSFAKRRNRNKFYGWYGALNVYHPHICRCAKGKEAHLHHRENVHEHLHAGTRIYRLDLQEVPELRSTEDDHVLPPEVQMLSVKTVSSNILCTKLFTTRNLRVCKFQLKFYDCYFTNLKSLNLTFAYVLIFQNFSIIGYTVRLNQKMKSLWVGSILVYAKSHRHPSHRIHDATTSS